MITCQELSGTSPESSMNLVFDESMILRWTNENPTNINYCEVLGIKSPKTYIDLSKFLISVPVIYLAGENDGATDLEQASYHYQNVARGDKTFFILKSGGHLPVLGALKDNRECVDAEDCLSMTPLKAQVAFFEYVLKSDGDISKEDLFVLNKNLELKWMIQK